jgi:hypothetical protein
MDYRFSIPAVRKNRKAFLDILVPHAGRGKEEFLGPVMDAIVEEFKCSSGKYIETYFEDVGEMSVEKAVETATVFAGDIEGVEAGREYRPWVIRKCYAAIYIDTVEPRPFGRRMYGCDLKVVGGPKAGTMLECVLPGGFLQNIVRECGGHKYGQYSDVEAGGLWFSCILDTSTKRTVFHDPTASHSQRKHNKKILQDRDQKCIQDLFDEKCFNCWAGRDRCYLARHALEYPMDVCRNTKGIKRHKGPIAYDGYCLHCLQTKLGR